MAALLGASSAARREMLWRDFAPSRLRVLVGAEGLR